MRLPLLGAIGLFACAMAAHAASGPVADDPALSIEPVVSGLAEPTAMAFVGTDDFLILEKSVGKVRRVTGGVLKPNAVLDLPVEHCDERGLLGIALHPDFASNHVLYLRPRSTRTASHVTSGTPRRTAARARSPTTAPS